MLFLGGLVPHGYAGINEHSKVLDGIKTNKLTQPKHSSGCHQSSQATLARALPCFRILSTTRRQLHLTLSLLPKSIPGSTAKLKMMIEMMVTLSQTCWLKTATTLAKSMPNCTE